MARRIATRTTIVEPDDFTTGLRYEWLGLLKVDELRMLCEHRNLDGDDASSKSALVSSIVKVSSKSDNYARWQKSTLVLELKARGVELADDASSLEDLKRLMEEHQRTKPTKKTLSELSLEELQKLASRRKIKTGAATKEKSVKQGLVTLLRDSQAPDPLYEQAMTIKQLAVELKGRGLSAHRLKKDELLKLLESDVTFEEQQLEQHIDSVGEVDIAKTSLVDYVQYIKSHAENIRSHVKNSNKGGKNGDDVKWDDMALILRDAREQFLEVREMIEAYSGADLGKDETMPSNQNFANVMKCGGDDLDDAQDGGVTFVVYEDDEELIMAQDRKSILGVFDSKSEAKAFKKQYLKNNKDAEVEIAEIEMN